MSLETKKIELIHWISELRDSKVLKELFSVKKKTESIRKEQRPFGAGKDIIAYIADDFNDPLDDFKEYTK